MTDGEIRSDFLCVSQAMTTYDQVVDTQEQAMTTQGIREAGHHDKIMIVSWLLAWVTSQG